MRAKTGLLAQLVILDLDFATVGRVNFLDKPVVGCRGWGLEAGGRGVMKVFWTGLTVGLEALEGTRWEVRGAGFWVGGTCFVNEGAPVFWIAWGLFMGVTEREETEGLVGGRWVGLVAAICRGWAAAGWKTLVELARDTEGEEEGVFLADCLASACGVWEELGSEMSGWTILRGLVGTAGAIVTMSPLLTGLAPRVAGVLVRFPRPSKAGSGCKAKAGPESQGKRAPTWGPYVSTCRHRSLRWAQ